MIMRPIDTTAFAKKGGNMKRLILLRVAAAFVASPVGVPLVLPSWSLPFYFGMHLDDTKNENKKK